jgi:serine/tyrosine/threonine adenylyltransferase
MFLRQPVRTRLPRMRLAQMANHLINGYPNGYHKASCTFADLPKSNVFTTKLPPDPVFPTPADSHNAPRAKLGPRMVRGALYTYVRPEGTEDPELLAVSERALEDIGLADTEAQSEEFKSIVAGNKILWTEEDGGIYPWAQCYGGWQFGSWAGQLGDGRAISLFESTNPETKVRYEIQLKGAGQTPYSRFADGKAVLRSSIREFVVS